MGRCFSMEEEEPDRNEPRPPPEPDPDKYSADEVLQAYDITGLPCERIHMKSPNVAVWEGKEWTFNGAPPIEPDLVKRIGACMSKVGMTYADAFNVIKDGCLGVWETTAGRKRRILQSARSDSNRCNK